MKIEVIKQMYARILMKKINFISYFVISLLNFTYTYGQFILFYTIQLLFNSISAEIKK